MGRQLAAVVHVLKFVLSSANRQQLAANMIVFNLFLILLENAQTRDQPFHRGRLKQHHHKNNAKGQIDDQPPIRPQTDRQTQG